MGLSFNVEKTCYKIISHDLPPAFSGFKIAHISDLHSRPFGGIYELISCENPNIIVITGDMLHDDEKPIHEFTQLLKKLLELAPVYMVSGNHDLGRIGHTSDFREICDLGGIILNNRRHILTQGQDKIALYGVCDPLSKIPNVINNRLEQYFSYLPEFDGYKILLFHRANLFDEIKNKGFNLILSGHMHGGQIRIPYFGGVLAPSSSLLSHSKMLFPEHTGGIERYKNTAMVVNRGASNTLPIPRFGNRPEVGIITLLSKR